MPNFQYLLGKIAANRQFCHYFYFQISWILFVKPKLYDQMEELDETDKAILRILQKDAKVTAKEIAARLKLTTSPIYDRIRRLEQNGFIKKYVAILDKTLINKSVTSLCQVSLRYHNEAFIENFEQEIQK